MRGAVVMVAAGILAGCGASGDGESADVAPLSREEYQSAMITVAEDRGREATRLWGEMVTTERPPSECERLVRRFHAALSSGVASVAELRPPSEIAEPHGRFVAAAGASVAKVGEVADRVGRGEISCGRDLNAALYGMPSTREAQKTLEEIEQAGIPIGGQ
jgi:hypothetical protein